MIKVCGVRSLDDLTLLSRAGVTAVGINLVQRSPRFADLDLAETLCRRAQELGLLCVAVLMDPDEAALGTVFDRLEVDLLQLHGSESPDLLSRFPQGRFIKAVSWSGRRQERALAEKWVQMAVAQADSQSATASLIAFLVDAFAPDLGGGSGKCARWDLLYPRPKQLQDIPMILAGGLSPDNVSVAIDATRPDGVDVASGVELAPGRKSAEKVAQFASNARSAFLRAAGE